jgi:hypothetical protein
VDSFDSSDPNYSTGGQYDPTKRSANALLLSNSTNSAAISLGTATIYGSVDTGPGVTTGNKATVKDSGAAVGDAAFDAIPQNAGKIETGHYNDDANVQINDVQAPFAFGTGYNPVGGTNNGTNYTYILGTGNYNLGALALASGQGVLVDGNAVLYVNANVSISSTGFIYIAPGATLQLYIGGVGKFANVSSISGQAIVNPRTASQMMIYGLPGCTQINYSGNGNYVGQIDAPEATVQVTGNGSLVGAFTVNNFSLGGNGGLHYDMALAKIGSGGYVVFSWNEF